MPLRKTRQRMRHPRRRRWDPFSLRSLLSKSGRAKYLVSASADFVHDLIQRPVTAGSRATWRGRRVAFEPLEERWVLTAIPFSEHAVDGSFDGATSVYSADVDGDGDMDILGAAFDADAITWWENTTADGFAWSEHSVDGDFDGAHCVYSADVDGDGDMDVLGAAHWAGITWWENTMGNGSTWTEHNVDADSIAAKSVHSADVDGDGDLDILGAAQMGDDITWWENTTGDGTVWAEHTVDGDFDGAHSVYSADIDGDGDLDVLGAAVYGDDITWWENSAGDGTAWIERTIDSYFSGAISVYSADVDGDGDLDVLGAASEADDITWWENVARDGSVWTEHTIDGSFEVATSVYAADMDSDGDLDVLGTAAYGLDDITWWENTSGDGSVWTEHAVDGSFDGAYAVYSADVDGDGDLDVLGAGRSADEILWWENKTIHSSGFLPSDYFEHAVDGHFFGAQSVHSADVDGDGDMDVLGAAMYRGTDLSDISWWENTTGDGGVWAEHAVAKDFDGARSVHPADVDGDGDLDVLGASEFEDEIAWWENTAGDGITWTRHTVDGHFHWARSVYSADVDGDGDMDVLGAASFDDEIAWWENRLGDGTVWAEHIVDGDFDGARSVYSADVDGDGDMDVLGAAWSADAIAWWENTLGDGSVWTEHTVDGDFDGAQRVHSADVDGDGDMDVLGAAYYAITWWENVPGDGNVWREHTVDEDFDRARSVHSADLDGDGDMDILGAARGADAITWWENVGGDGTVWTEYIVDGSFYDATSVYSADVDGDGNLDILGAASGDGDITWWGNETIHSNWSIPNEALEHVVDGDFDGARDVYSADVDGDGDMDVLGAAHLAGIIWWENVESDGSVWTEHAIDRDASGASVHSADIDGDGDMDVLGSGGYTITWWENAAGDGSVWIERTVDDFFWAAYSVFSADVDGDGDLDVLGAAFVGNDITWWENTTGDGSVWVKHPIDWNFRGASSVSSVDVDGDGDMDVLGAAEYASEISWWENTEGDGGVWKKRTVSESLGFAQCVYSADMDGDGDMDVLGAGSGAGAIKWWENKLSDGTVWIEHTVDGGSWGTNSVYAADVDRDGDIDVLSAASSANDIAWWENTAGDGSVWTDHLVDGNLDGARGAFAADVDGDGDMDVLGAAEDAHAITWWENRGGQFALVTTDSAQATIGKGQVSDVLRIVAIHRGRTGDSDLGLVAFDLLFEESAGDPLTTAEANNLIANLMIYVDADGNETFDSDHDTLVTTVGSLSLNAGVQTISFDDGDPNVQVSFGAPRTYFVVTELTDDASNHSPNQFRIVHRTEAGSTAEDRVYDIELTMEWAADTASSVVTASPVEVQFSQTTFQVNEDGAPSGAQVTLTRNATSGTSQVRIGFGNTGTAIAGTDFDDAPIDVTFDSGDDTATVTIPIAQDDVVELDETIGLEVTAISGAIIGTQNTATLTIVDDDAATISINDIAHDEGEAGTTQFAFTVTLDAEVDTPVLVDFATADGSAEAQNLDGDYQSAAGTLNFVGQAGEQQTITVNITGDDVLEPDEDFFVNLTGIVAGGRNVTFAGNQGRGRILRDEPLENTLTVVTAEIASPGQIDEHTLDLTQGPANGVYSIQVLDYRDDGLDPGAVEILDANDDPIPVRQRIVDANYDGASASAVIVQLTPGQYRVRVGGANGTTGRYRLDVRMPGVVDEEGVVHKRSVRQAEVCMLQQQFGFNAIAQGLFGHKLGFDLTTDQFRPEFDANLSGEVDPVDLDAIISNYGDGAPIQAIATLTSVVTLPAQVINVLGEPEAGISLSGSTIAVYQNPNLAADVNADGQVTSLDVLLVINRVNADNAESADETIGEGDPPSGEGEMGLGISPPFYDVNGDCVVSPLDVLLVINSLNAADPNAHPAAAEGEATSTIPVTRLGLVTHLPRVSASQEPAGHSARRREPGNEGQGREVFEVHRSFTSKSPKLRTTASSEPFELDADLVDLLAEDVDAAQASWRLLRRRS